MKFELRVQELLDMEEAVRNSRDEKEIAHLLEKGLSQSCDLLRFMIDEALLSSLDIKPMAWQTFERLRRNNALHTFLESERRLLQTLTDLRPDSVALMVSALSLAIDEMIKRKGFLDAKWVALLKDLSITVCEKAKSPSTESTNRKWSRLLKRAALAGSGGVIAIVNKLARTNPKLAALNSLLDLSESGGIFLLGVASQGVLDEWVQSQNTHGTAQ